MNFKVIPCKVGGRWKIVADGIVRLDLGKVGKRFEVVVDGGIAVVVRDERGEFIVKKTGEIRFKSERSKEECGKIADEVYGCG
ncbi:hypothetical protein CMO92_03435 [Candidatus Woesearchaeota archaeon]|nr:hypothetical protein [Candidatus Woesearchaeota archaeon]